MTPSRFVFKTHKWLATGAGIFLLMWCVSGIVMVLPERYVGKMGARPASVSGEPDYKSIAISVPQAIATVEAAAGGNIVTNDVRLWPIEGRLYYEISTTKLGSYLIDVVSGARLEITEEYAKQMATRFMGGRGPLLASELLRTGNSEYKLGPLPAYRISFGDPAATIVYVCPTNGVIFTSDHPGRIRGFIKGMHTFEILNPLLARRGARTVMVFFSLLGVVTAIFGGWILLIQFQNWQARRAGRPEMV